MAVSHILFGIGHFGYGHEVGVSNICSTCSALCVEATTVCISSFITLIAVWKYYLLSYRRLEISVLHYAQSVSDCGWCWPGVYNVGSHVLFIL